MVMTVPFREGLVNERREWRSGRYEALARWTRSFGNHDGIGLLTLTARSSYPADEKQQR
jgi:hypothetical protein